MTHGRTHESRCRPPPSPSIAHAAVAERRPVPRGPPRDLGPALEGKGPLASTVLERLPHGIAIGASDDLAGPATSERELLEAARSAWRGRHEATATVMLQGRFGTAATRRAAATLARDERMAFLLVESTSTAIRSLRQVSRLFLPTEEVVRRLERYELARKAYSPVTEAERTQLPALSLRRVLSDLDGAADRVLRAWASRAR